MAAAACRCLPLWRGGGLTPFLFSPQYEVSGEEHLYSDFPEIDLSQLDASDFDSAGCFGELQWCGEHSETDSSQYSTDDSELFQVPPSPWHRGPADGGRGRAGEGEKEGGRWGHTQLLIAPPQLISAPLICVPALNGASGVRLMRRWLSRGGLLSQPSCDVSLKGNYSWRAAHPVRFPGWQGVPGRQRGGLRAVAWGR